MDIKTSIQLIKFLAQNIKHPTKASAVGKGRLKKYKHVLKSTLKSMGEKNPPWLSWYLNAITVGTKRASRERAFHDNQ